MEKNMNPSHRIILFPIHLRTAIILLLIAAVLLWLNLRPTKYEVLLGPKPPLRLDPVTRGMFYYGWPFSPCMLCVFHGMQWHPEESFCEVALLADAVVAFAVLAAAGFLSEWFIRHRAVMLG
jgi:hypothetical protein